MHQQIALLWLALTLGVIAGMGCIQPGDFDDLELEPSQPVLAFPLLDATVTATELAGQLSADAEVTVNEDGVMTAFFFADPVVRTKQALFPPTVIGLPLPILDTVVSLPVPVLEEGQLKRAVLKGDTLSFILNSLENEDVFISISIPELARDGETFLAEYLIPGNGPLPGSLVTPPIDLNGYEVDFSNGSLSLSYLALAGGQRITLPLSFAIITAFDFAYLEGAIAPNVFNTGEQIIDIALTDTILSGSYRFLDPKVHFDLVNSFGVPVGVQVKTVSLQNANGDIDPIQSTLFEQLILLDYPSIDAIGDSTVTRVTFDRQNSNIVEVLQGDLQSLIYNIDIVINPEDLTDDNFFMTDSSMARIEAAVELPFDAAFSRVEIREELEIDLKALDSISRLRLKLVADNGLAFSFDPLLSFANMDGSTVLELRPEDNTSISAASVDSDGEVMAINQSVLFFNMDEQQVKQLVDLTALDLQLVIASPNGGSDPGRLRPEQELRVRIGAEAELE